MPNRRQSSRVDLAGPLTAEVLIVQPARVTELAPDGMQVETGSALQLNAIYEFRLRLGGRTVIVKGRVAHARISDVDRDLVTYCSGIEFVEVSERVASAINGFVDGVRRERGKWEEPPRRDQ
jgi:hypothetical protein